MSVNNFSERLTGSSQEADVMLNSLGLQSIEELIDKTVPSGIRIQRPLRLPDALSESEYLAHIWEIASKNKLFKTYIGLGYYNTYMPSVIQRNIFENPSWYTSYTPYQAEISQGRLEALLNFQTMVMELTSMPLANASLLDEATAAAETMLMFYNCRTAQQVESNANTFFVDEGVFPQTYDVLLTRAEPFGIKIIKGNYQDFAFSDDVFGCLLQYPNVYGEIHSYQTLIDKAHEHNIQVSVAADLLSLALLVPPGRWGADVVLGSTQRFGVPIGYGGPHAAYFAANERYKRNLPGRIIGVSIDTQGRPALRMALQTREQHIKRERATSNICTAQALLAIMAGMYAVYHGPEGLKAIARKIHFSTSTLAHSLSQLGYTILNASYFDTLTIQLPNELRSSELKPIAEERQINIRYIDEYRVSVSLDETTTLDDLNQLIELFAVANFKRILPLQGLREEVRIPAELLRTDAFMQQEVFQRYHTETEMMRYIKKLERRDISLTHSMISLGSCTMKLNAATTMLPLSWPEWANIHPFVPLDQVEGYHQMMHDLGEYLCEITGFPHISFQPNSGAAGEYTGLMVIRKYQQHIGQGNRKVVLIPSSAHGTNPASAAMAGMQVVVVKCDQQGNIDVDDLRQKAEQYKDSLCCIMITYPSTHGVFEEAVTEICDIVHQYGGQVYMDGANMNAQVGITQPALIGADVCHLNLHKTFGIPHGGGGPGAGPICVADHLVEFLPTHPLAAVGGRNGIHAVAASPWGSAYILQISYAYIRLLGASGLHNATQMAILKANYLANRLSKKYKIVYTGKNNTVAHEFIVDCRDFKKTADVTEIDIAKRLMDFGYHAPTVSFPVPGTLMIEPTESESLAELERFIEAMYCIYDEIEEIAAGKYEKNNNVLKNAPHTAEMIAADNWSFPYSRIKAAFPLPWVRENKFWPYSSRINDAYGDRNLVCSCSGFSF
ncbi:MAG TPA: aminomethyl-transferring glycine dehydrogenase [Bacteroidales bacterium]|nr:aminomethyl-transferring glycine dehydrogenase [Bacteroidales bacterium]HPO65385.1 aminomethyl-transferring glycine dehydrogenase [Bacteroidales bacterium]